MDCEICGNPIFGRRYQVIIDGSELIVCKACSTMKTSPQKPRTQISQPLSQSLAVSRPRINVRRREPSKPSISEGEELIPDYGQVIRKAREALRLSQEDLSRKIAEKASVIQKLESGKLVPPDALVQKLERVLKVKLKVAMADVPVDEKLPKPSELTLGDIAIMRNKQGEAEDVEERRY
ncbi:MAG: multiprotein bridging factor aMBF1 [Candidatus Bathyarchaeia archaeon]